MLQYNKTNDKYFFNGKEITKEKYDEIVEIIKNKPTPSDGYDYRLMDDLTWELFELEKGELMEDVEDNSEAEEILNILLGEEND